MSQIITFFCSGLCVYWTMRAWLLVSADKDEIDQVLDVDWRIIKNVLIALRAMLIPPTQI
jgi:hypothetical protein